MSTVKTAITVSVLPGRLVMQVPLVMAKENCNQEALESAIRSGLVMQAGRKPVLRNLIHLPSCGKTVTELLVEARGHEST